MIIKPNGQLFNIRCTSFRDKDKGDYDECFEKPGGDHCCPHIYVF